MTKLHVKNLPNIAELQRMLVGNIKIGLKKKIGMFTAKRVWVDGSNFDPKDTVLRLIAHLENRKTDKLWLLKFLASLHTAGVECIIFHRDYAGTISGGKQLSAIMKMASFMQTRRSKPNS